MSIGAVTLGSKWADVGCGNDLMGLFEFDSNCHDLSVCAAQMFHNQLGIRDMFAYKKRPDAIGWFLVVAAVIAAVTGAAPGSVLPEDCGFCIDFVAR